MRLIDADALLELIVKNGIYADAREINNAITNAPPQKQWVGLTTRQLEHIEEKSYVLQTGVNDYEFDFIQFAKAIEAKLKELNT